MEKKHIIDIISITDEDKYIHETKSKTLDEFKDINFEDIVINHHKKNAVTSTYTFNENQKPQIVILLTQDKELIKELKLPTYTEAESPNDSLELFENNGLENVSLKNILNGMEQNSKNDFLFNFDSRDYSISIAQGNPANKLIRSINMYIEDIQNMKEYEETQKNSLKL